MPGIEKREFITLFNEMFQPVKNYVYYKVGDIEVAEDIAQDAFTKVWEKRSEIRLKTVKSLLFTIASNLCKNRFEHQQVVFEFANNYSRNQWEVSPEFELELKEFNAKLQQEIARLSEKNRTVFLMNRIDGFTYREIANNLGVSVKAVEKRMKNALTELKKTIEYKL
ncbi:RNA polymerase sigma-70 factor [uncultured Draconibacterium sp.]|uniref:RNA polymerase sigma-70 factor n=1 Tax=uncultured Draconibacterium sp. TaxID=1573823 RepID=UPI0032607C95